MLGCYLNSKFENLPFLKNESVFEDDRLRQLPQELIHELEYQFLD